MAPGQYEDDDVSADLSGPYLKQSDFESGIGVIFTVASVEKVSYEAKNGRPASDKWVITFVEGDKRFPLNKTNLSLMVKWFGKHHRAWGGQAVAVYLDESISFGGRTVGGLRLRRPTKYDVPALETDLVSSDPIPF